MRVGFGYDVHRLVAERPLILGGVTIPYEKGLLGHSDADVVVHAVIDALFGAAGLGDIGRHFPDTDPNYKGISSITLLEQTRAKLEERFYFIENIDVTILAQQPKLVPYMQQMQKNLAQALQLEEMQVNVKATTEEGLGFTGRSEGIAAHAVCLLTTVENLIAQAQQQKTGCCGGCKREK